MGANGAAVWLCARELFRDTFLRCVCSDPLTMLGHMHEVVPERLCMHVVALTSLAACASSCARVRLLVQ